MKIPNNIMFDSSRKDDMNLIGKSFSKLICSSVVGYITYSDRILTAYLFTCTCGNKVILTYKNVITGHTASCGCLRQETASKQGKKNIKDPNDNPAFERYYNQYKSQAKRRGLEFSLEKDYFKSLTTQNCHYCGAQPAKSFGKNWKGYSLAYICNGVDRKDNEVGYTTDNVLPCCAFCNYAKKDYSYEIFLNWLKRAGEFQNKNDLVQL